MLHLLKEFALDESEIDVDEFKKQINLLNEKFEKEHETKPISFLFKKTRGKHPEIHIQPKRVHQRARRGIKGYHRHHVKSPCRTK